MTTPGGSGRFLLLALLTLSILLDGYLIAPLFPWVSTLGGIRPMLVFLDIPLGTPYFIDLLPTGLLFTLFLYIFLGANPSRFGHLSGAETRRRVAKVLGGLFGWLGFVVAGSVLFYFIREFLPKEVRNGVDSFGVQLDLSSSIPGFEVMHLHGGMFMLVGAIIGTRLLLKRTAAALRPALPAEETQALPGAVAVAAERSYRRIVSQVPAPKEIRRPEDVWLQEKARRAAITQQTEETGRQQAIVRAEDTGRQNVAYRTEEASRQNLARQLQAQEARQTEARQRDESIKVAAIQRPEPAIALLKTEAGLAASEARNRIQVQRPEEVRKPTLVNTQLEQRARLQQVQQQEEERLRQQADRLEEERQRQQADRLEEERRRQQADRLEEARQRQQAGRSDEERRLRIEEERRVQERQRLQEIQRLEEIRRQAEVLRLEELRQIEEIRRLEHIVQSYRDRATATSVSVVAPVRVELPL